MMKIFFSLITVIKFTRGLEESIWDNEHNYYFDYDKFFDRSDPNLSNEKICFKSSCKISPTKCIVRDLEAFNMYFSSCGEDQKCQILTDYSGTCIKDFGKNRLKFLYTGEVCNPNAIDDSVCGYGKQRLKIIKPVSDVKMKNAKGLKKMTAVNTTLIVILDFSAKWENGEACNYDNQCGREALCYFGNDFDLEGLCAELFTIENGAEFNVLNSFNDGLRRFASPLSRYLCISGITLNNGTCSKGYRSNDKGAKCFSDEDCSSEEDSNVKSKCRCVYSTDGSAYCDLHSGDDEWLEAIDAFKKYYEATKKCHAGLRWKECGQPELYKDWKCKEIKAQHYALLKQIEVLPCINEPEFQPWLPILSQYRKYCFLSFTLNLLQIIIFLLSLSLFT